MSEESIFKFTFWVVEIFKHLGQDSGHNQYHMNVIVEEFINGQIYHKYHTKIIWISMLWHLTYMALPR